MIARVTHPQQLVHPGQVGGGPLLAVVWHPHFGLGEGQLFQKTNTIKNLHFPNTPASSLLRKSREPRCERFSRRSRRTTRAYPKAVCPPSSNELRREKRRNPPGGPLLHPSSGVAPPWRCAWASPPSARLARRRNTGPRGHGTFSTGCLGGPRDLPAKRVSQGGRNATAHTPRLS